MKIIHTKLIKIVSGVFLSGFLFSVSAFAEEVEFSTTIAPTLNVVIPADTITLAVSPKTGEPSFVSQDFKIVVSTNNPTGYSLTLEAPGTDLTRVEADNFGNYPIIKTLDVLEGGYSQDNFTVNRWGYKQDNGNYVPFRTSLSLSGTEGPTNGDATTLTFGAKIDMHQQAGTYKLALNFQTVANIVPGVTTITFEPNGADGGTMGMQQIEAGKTAVLNENMFTRTDYNFLGWNTEQDGSGVFYADGADFSVGLSEENEVVVLYAQWAQHMQTYTASQCASEAASAPVTLVDKRDDKEYRVRYINGVCTMIDNLALDPGTTGLTLKPEDSNVTQERIMMARIISPTSVHFTGNTDSYTNQQTACQNNSNTGNYECYYNYAAATVGTITGDSNTTEATESICPKNWRLPSGSNTTGENEQFILNNSYTWQQWNAAYKPATTTTTPGPEPFSPVAAGLYNSGSLKNSGTYGYWWSSTVYTADAAGRYILYYDTSNGLLSGGSSYSYSGFSVRCVAGS